jgi:penicillin-binding protein 1A
MNFRNLKKWLLLAVLSGFGLAIILLIFFFSVYTGIFGPIPNKEELKSIHNEEASLVFSSDGKLLGKYFAENRTNISIYEIPNHLIQALIATEDKRFFEHQGYDTRSYFRVIFKTLLLRDRSSGGGSTITQQLAKNIYGRNDHSFLSLPVSKVKEAIIAARMEKVYSKDEILALYLNSVPFGEEVFGVEAASIRYFNKSAKSLNLQEAAVLVGILKANTYYNPRLNPDNAKSRRNQILELMHQQNYLTLQEKDSLQKTDLELSYSNYSLFSPAAYFVKQVKDEVHRIIKLLPNNDSLDIRKDGLKIYTSLNAEIQEFSLKSGKKQLQKMQELLDQQLKNRNFRTEWESGILEKYHSEEAKELRNREIFDWDGIQSKEITAIDSLWHYYKMLHAAILIAEPKTGRIISWVGGNNFRYLPYDMIYAKRQAASAFKPLIYAAALENGMEPDSYLENEEKEYENYKNWNPQNYNRQQTKDSLVALWYALSNSMNLPTVDLYFKTGHPQIAELLRRYHFQPPLNETPSIALGTMDVSLYEMVQAYASFANGGVYFEKLSLIDSICDAQGNLIYKNPQPTGREVMARQVTQEITEILQEAINAGTGRAIRNRFGFKSDLAGKTGTAQNYTDAWFMSYTPEMLIGVWVGASSPDVHFYNGLGSGSALALPISGEIWKEMENNKVLRNAYLLRFEPDSILQVQLSCPPFKEKGVDGFIHRLFNGDRDDAIQADSASGLSKKEERIAKKEERKRKRNAKEKTKVGKFFDRLFKGKNKEK